MKRKKKSKKKKTALPSLPAAEETLIISLLKEIKNTDPYEITAKIPDSRLAQILVERLPLSDEQSIPLLSAINDCFNDKQVHKAVKLALFKLKRAGVQVKDIHSEKRGTSTILKQPQEEKPVVYIGPVNDMTGSRATLIALHKPMEGYDVGLGIVSDENGIQQYLFGTYSKKRTKKVIDHLSQIAGPLVETSLSHSFTILENAYKCHNDLNSNPPAEYLELRPWLLENASIRDKPVIYDFMPEESISGTILTDSQLEKLFEHDLMENWLIDFERLKPFMEDSMKVDDSPIVLTEAQKFDRTREIKNKGIEELFPASKRDLLKYRLEEMAYIFLKLDKEEYSEISLIAARTMVQESTILTTNPVIEFLLEYSYSFYYDGMTEVAAESQDPSDSPSPSILLP